MSLLPERASIESLCLSVTSGGTPSRKRDEFWTNGTIPWLKTGELRDRLIFDAEERITELGLTGSSAKLFPPDTVLMAMYGDGKTITSLGIIKNEIATNQACCAMIADPAKCNYRFLYYALMHHRPRLLGLVVAGAQRNLSIGIIKKFEIDVFPIGLQTRIADILSTYDDLIENNRRRIQLLEQSARLLYKEWFVHLRFPGHEHVPVVDRVPEGWERRSLGACARFLSGGTPSKARTEFWQGEVPWVSSGELTAMRVHHTKLSITEEAIAAGSRCVPAKTILAVVRGMSLAKEFRLGLTARTVSFNQDIKALIAEPGVDPLLLFHAIDAQRDTIRDRAGDASHGTKKLSTPVLEGIPILVPQSAVQAAFRRLISSFHGQWDVLYNQNARLEKARDLLLPRLMSGEIPV